MENIWWKGTTSMDLLGFVLAVAAAPKADIATCNK